MTIHNSLAELIGNTPLVKLNHIPQAAGVKATIAVKVEYFNPGGSSKDRIAERIIDAAEKSGQLKPGGVIVEPTSGNTGVGLALVAQQRGYRTISPCRTRSPNPSARCCAPTVPKSLSRQPTPARTTRAPTTRSPNDCQYDSRRFRPNQYDNPNGPLSHYYTTGPEIWEPRTTRSRTSWPASAPAAPSPAPASTSRKPPTARSRSSLRPGRLHLLRFLTRRSPPVRYRGRRGGLLPQGLRPEHHRRHRARVRRRSL